MLVPRAISSSMSISSASVRGRQLDRDQRPQQQRAAPAAAPVAAKTRPRWRIATLERPRCSGPPGAGSPGRTASPRARPRCGCAGTARRASAPGSGPPAASRPGRRPPPGPGPGTARPLVVRAKTTGRKMTQVVSVEATIAPATSRAPTRAASSAGRPPLLALADDALQHDDGVVDDQADPQRQPAEGHLVQGHAAEVEQPEGGDHRDRDGEGDDRGARSGCAGRSRAPATASSEPHSAEVRTLAIDWRMNSLWSLTTARWTSSRSALMRSISRRTASRHGHRVGAALLLDRQR